MKLNLFYKINLPRKQQKLLFFVAGPDEKSVDDETWKCSDDANVRSFARGGDGANGADDGEARQNQQNDSQNSDPVQEVDATTTLF